MNLVWMTRLFRFRLFPKTASGWR